MRLYKDFGPIVQARKELEEMSEMRRHTNQLLQNILPLHVAKYFLEQDRQFHELYAQGKPDIIYFHLLWYFFRMHQFYRNMKIFNT